MTTPLHPCPSRYGTTPCERPRGHPGPVHSQGSILWRGDGPMSDQRQPSTVHDIERIPALDAALDLIDLTVDELRWARSAEDTIDRLRVVVSDLRADRGRLLSYRHDRERRQA